MITSFCGGTIQQGNTAQPGLYIIGGGTILQQSTTNACVAGSVSGCFALN